MSDFQEFSLDIDSKALKSKRRVFGIHQEPFEALECQNQVLSDKDRKAFETNKANSVPYGGPYFLLWEQSCLASICEADCYYYGVSKLTLLSSA